MMEVDPTREIDFFTKEPRRRNIPYSVMSEEQLKHIQKNGRPGPLFQNEQMQEAPDERRHYMDRYTYFTDRTHVRPHTTDYCHVGPLLTRDLDPDHDNSRFGAMYPWGPDKVGHPTLKNFVHQDVTRFVNIDMYKRNPTNYPGEIRHKFGRANLGYYAQRNPNRTLWFGGTNGPKFRSILEDIKPKTIEEHKEIMKAQQADAKSRFPNISHYTEKFCLRKVSRGAVFGLQARKLHLERAKEMMSDEDD